MLQKLGLQCRLLNTYHIAMKESVRGFKVAALLILVENLQLAMLLFASMESQVRHATQNFAWILEVLSVVVPLHDNESVEHGFLTVAALIILAVTTLHGICLFKPSFGRVLRYVADVYMHVLFVPLVSGLVMMLSKGIKVFQIGKLLASGALLIVAVGYFIILELLVIMFDLSSEDITCRNPKTRYYFKPFLLVLLSLMFVLNFQRLFDHSFDLLIGCYIVFYFQSLYETVAEMIYHKRQLQRFRICVLLLFLSVAIWDGIAYNIQIDLVGQNFFEITLVFYCFVVVLVLNYRNYIVKGLLAESAENIQKPYYFHIKLRANYELLMDCKKEKSNMLRSSVIRSHATECVNVQCLCRSRETLYDPSTREWSNMSVAPHNDPIYCKFFLKMLLEEGRDKFRESRLIELTWLYLKWGLLRLYQDIFREITIYNSMFERESNLGDSYLLYHLRKEIKAFLEMRNVNNSVRLMIEDVEKFDSCYETLKQEIKQIVEIHESLWKVLSETVVDRPVLLKVVADLANRKAKIEQIFQQTIRYNPTSVGLLVVMHRYSSKVVFDPKLTKRVRQSITIESAAARESNFKFPIDFRGDNQTATLKISIEEDDMSKVLWVSNQFAELFGYQKKDVIGTDLEKLMPDIYRKHHTNWIREWKQKGIEINMNNLKQVFIVDRSSNLCSCDGFVKIIPCLDRYEVLGMLRKNNEKDYVIVEDRTGRICSAGTTFTSEILSCNPQIFEKANVEIQIFSPELLSILDKKEPWTNRSACVHFLVPKNVTGYIHNLSAEKHFAERRRVNPNQNIEALKSEQQNTLKFQVQDLITDSERLQKIMYANVRIQKVEHVKAKRQQVTYYLIKIIDITQINEVPVSVKNFQEQIKEETYQRLATLREFRKTRQQLSIDLFMKMLNEKRVESQNNSRHSVNSVRRKEIAAAGRTSIAIMVGSNYLKDSKKSKMGEDSPRRLSYEKTVEKVKNALYRAGVIGRSPFSHFFGKMTSKLPRFGHQATKGLGTRDFYRSGSMDVDSYYIQKERNESESFQKEDIQNEIRSGLSTNTNCTTDLDYEELQKRLASNREHSSLRKYKLGLLIVFLLYVIPRIAGIVITTKTLSNFRLQIIGYAESCQVMMLTQLEYNSAMLFLIQKQSASNQDISLLARNTNFLLSNMLQRHLQDSGYDILHALYNQYLYMYVANDIKKVQQVQSDALKLIKIIQVEASDIISYAGEDELASQALKNNYKYVRRVSRNINTLSLSTLGALSQLIRVCQMVHSTLHCVLYIILIILVFKYLRISQNWIAECLDVMASTSMETSTACCKYYRSLREDKSSSQTTINLDIEDFIQGYQISRISHTKGSLAVWFQYPLLLLIAICSANELSIVSGYQSVGKLNTFPDLVSVMYQGYSTLIEPFARFKEDVYFGTPNITRFNKLAPQTFTYFVNYTQLAFSKIQGTSYTQEFRDILQRNVCESYSQSPIPISYQDCSLEQAARFGLPLQAESLSMYITKTYKRFVNQPSLGAQLVSLPQEFGMYYFFNGWVATWEVLQRNMDEQVKNVITTSIYIEVLSLTVFFVLSILLVWVYTQAAKRVNKISAYILIVPRRVFLDNQYAKRYLRKFL